MGKDEDSDGGNFEAARAGGGHPPRLLAAAAAAAKPTKTSRNLLLTQQNLPMGRIYAHADVTVTEDDISQDLMYHLLAWGQKDKLFTFKSTVATHAGVSRYTGYWQLHLGDK